MSDRRAQMVRFLDSSPWRDWRVEPIATDASARSYARLRGPEGSVILMDADPATNPDTPAFVAIAEWLTARDFAAPRVLARDPDGFLVLSDLGETRLSDALETDSMLADRLFDAATDTLVRLDAAPPPPGLAALTPQVAGEMVAITAELYARTDPASLSAATEAAYAGLVPDRVALRDVHVENLIWRDAAADRHRVGLLDFQDALLAPRGYDLASMLSDVRRDVPAAQRQRQIVRFAEATGETAETVARDTAILGAQRNLRILGVFTRLIASGKPRYAALMPKVRATLARDLAHPALSDLARTVARILPEAA